MSDALERIKKEILEKKEAELSLSAVEGVARLLVDIPASAKAHYDQVFDFYKKTDKYESKKEMLTDWIEREHKKIFGKHN